MNNLSPYTTDDIQDLRKRRLNPELMIFKKYLIVELRENYKLNFKQIGYLLKTKAVNLKELYYHSKDS